jgi:hypothetical protein
MAYLAPDSGAWIHASDNQKLTANLSKPYCA